jgi:hypothetical protein
MQLINKKKKGFNKKKNIAQSLALAAASLISSGTFAEANDDQWKFSGSLLLYSEKERVSASEMILTADKSFNDGGRLAYKVIFDTLTGASANGAIVQKEAQTFTRPSGNGQFTISPNETSLDDTFKDTRYQFNINWSDVLTKDYRYTVGSNFSKEYDYQSIGVNAGISKELDRKNTTLSLGFSFASDTVTPIGGRPLGLSRFNSLKQKKSILNGDGNIDTSEILLGWTQIINRRMITQFNYGYSTVDGYLTDPFKILSVINQKAEVQRYVYESRPEKRTQHRFFTSTKYHLEDSILNLSYRYFVDDWEIKSHTIDFKWLFFVNNKHRLEPHIRYYQQSAADFYHPYLADNQKLPSFASADYRIGEMKAFTLGLKYGFTFDSQRRIEVRAEYYRQTPEAHEKEAILAASHLDLYPEIEAFSLQFTYFY